MQRRVVILPEPLYVERQELFYAAGHSVIDAIEGLSARGVTKCLRTQRAEARGYMRLHDLDLIKVETAAFNVDNVEAQAFLILSAGCSGFFHVHYATHWDERSELVQLLPERMELVSKFTAIRRRLAPPPLVRSFLADLGVQRS